MFASPFSNFFVLQFYNTNTLINLKRHKLGVVLTAASTVLDRNEGSLLHGVKGVSP